MADLGLTYHVDLNRSHPPVSVTVVALLWQIPGLSSFALPVVRRGKRFRPLWMPNVPRRWPSGRLPMMPNGSVGDGL